ncbi:alpha/beta hydrolase [Hymenobacter sediminis]|uniref:alpha/beta fold hydrolase n=1 Tax=Hymenobacter sediminis TaxID=2218621 RepID=UPI000DA6B5CD|nr:alpha/beta hydrolase [Hymenobacter sediminis]RPD47887.1 alpha/beta hydrolase [Hymenobacter sediminis]
MDALRRNNVTVLGTGSQAMVLVHGFGCDQRMWRLITPAFEACHRIVLLDLVGAGNSALGVYDPVRYSSLQAHAEDVLDVLRALNLHQVVLVGHSVSAIIGMLAAIREPERFACLVLVAPSPSFINDGDYIGGFEREDIDELLEAMDNNYLGWSGSITPVIMGNPERPELAEELNTSFCQTDPTIARHFARATFLADHRPDLPRLHTPALILQCAQDTLAPRQVGEYMHEHLPDSELIVLDTSGHCPHLSAPQATVAAIRQYLVPTPTLKL